MAGTKTTRARRHPFEPDYAIAPGRTLQETLESLGMGQRELALRTGLSTKHINLLIKGKAPLTYDTANLLERVTGVPARMWNNLEMNYRQQVAKLEARRRLERDLAWLREIPTRELIERGKIQDHSNKVALLQDVLSFFGVASVVAWKKLWASPKFTFRKSPAIKGKVGAMATWLRLGELEAHAIPCHSFDKTEFGAALAAIRPLTLELPEVFVPAMTERCASAGVAVVLVPEIIQAPASGATRWLTPDKAMIQLSLRYKSNDQLWFSFFHEAGHILHDSKKDVFVDDGESDDEREQRANRFAADYLIPPQRAAELHQLKGRKAIEKFAKSIGIAPGIIVGRLQRDRILGYNRFNGLKLRLKWNQR